jgi:hypothetical protein
MEIELVEIRDHLFSHPPFTVDTPISVLLYPSSVKT